MPVAPGSAARAAAVERLQLAEFRCYAHLDLALESGLIVLIGANGAGKTNLLEAVSFLAPGRGLRNARLSEVARRDPGAEADSERAWAVAARVVGPEGVLRVGTARAAPDGEETRDRRLVHVDGEPARSQSDLARALGVVWLTPSMDRLFGDAPSARRRFLDRIVLGADPGHAARVAAYEQAMRERSRLLRDGAGDAAWLAALEEQMAGLGVAIAAARLETAERLNRVLAAAAGPFPRASVAAEGRVEEWLADMPALAAEDRLRAALAAGRRTDAETGGAAAGPHRSDLAVRHEGRGLAVERCSTGEQKAALIALVLAQARLQADLRGAAPVMLLDEVAAHLDQRRRDALLATLADLGAQAWLTGTDGETFAALAGRAQTLRVEDGRIAAG